MASLKELTAYLKDGAYFHGWSPIRFSVGSDSAEFYVSSSPLETSGVFATANPLELSEACELLEGIAATPFLLDKRYELADVQNSPKPKWYPGGVGMGTLEGMRLHTKRVLSDLPKDLKEISILGNGGKHWTYPLKLEKLYGWHIKTDATRWQGIKLYDSLVPGYKVIQPHSGAHKGFDDRKIEPTHEDYSMSVVLVFKWCWINGQQMLTQDVYSDPKFTHLVWGKGSFEANNPTLLGQDSASPTLKPGDYGLEVLKLQQRLTAVGIKTSADGAYGGLTTASVKRLQREVGLPQTGIADWATRDKLSEPSLRINIVATQPWPSIPRPVARPKFGSLTTDQRQKKFGVIKFKHSPSASNPEKIQLLNSVDLELVIVDQLTASHIIGAPPGGKVLWNAKGVKSLLGFFAEVEERGLLPLVLSWSGAYAPRLKRGYRGDNPAGLSSHAWATAFDINYVWNMLGKTPTAQGKRGSVVDLVPIAHKWGFYWGGHFSNRPDGMHFELSEPR